MNFFFHLIFPCAIFFVLPPPPHKFSNGPSLTMIRIIIALLSNYALMDNDFRLWSGKLALREQSDFLSHHYYDEMYSACRCLLFQVYMLNNPTHGLFDKASETAFWWYF